MQNAKYFITILVLISLSLGYYTFALSTETIEKRIERENKSLLLECLNIASQKPTSEEVLRATRDCNENILTKINRPVGNSGSGKINNTGTGKLAPTTSEPPLGRIKQKSPVKTAVQHGKTTGEKISQKSQSMSADTAQSKNFWTTYDLAIPLIQKYEGIRLKAYWDHAGYSIGYGTRAKYAKEVITQAEADRRLGYIVKQVISRVQRDFPTLNSKQQAGLVSFAFNCNSGYTDVKKRGLGQHKYWCKTAGNKRLQGLVNRRAEEALFIFSN